MTRNEQLEFCKKCTNRKFDPKQGLICSITEKQAEFEDSCENYELDAFVEKSNNQEGLEVEGDGVYRVEKETIEKLKSHQDFYYAIFGGLIAALISGLIWAAITVSTQYQIGFMAVGVGLLVGFSIRFFGAGIDKKFGYLGAVLSLLGCVIGNLFSQVGLIAEDQSLEYFETLTYLNFGLIIEILAESFNPIDLLFYGIAVYEGYRFALRKISGELLVSIQEGNSDGSPDNHKLRMPLFVGSVILLAVFAFKISKGVSGFKTYYHENGNKMSEGELKDGKEFGFWSYYNEDGIIQTKGFFTKGIADSLWSWYNEEGKLVRQGSYNLGLEHGPWISYYENGTLSDSGGYFEGRMSGLWKAWYENSNLSQIGYYKRNMQDSLWKYYFENGQLSAAGNYKDDERIGTWKEYYNDGKPAIDYEYISEDKTFIKNAWNPEGKQIVLDGNGEFKAYSEEGKILSAGKLEDGDKIGIWKTYYPNGKLKESGRFEKDTYFLESALDIAGLQTVKNGEGTFTSYYPETNNLFEKGEVRDGLREGLWDLYYDSTSIIFQKLNYKAGKLNGQQMVFYESGALFATGEWLDGSRDGEWNWFYESGIVSSNVSYKDGLKQGLQTIWSEAGEKTKEEFYENGDLIEEKVFQ